MVNHLTQTQSDSLFNGFEMHIKNSEHTDNLSHQGNGW